MIKAAIFDMDGVLLDSMPAWRGSGRLYLAKRNITAEKNLDAVLYKKSLLECAQYMKNTYRLTETDDEVLQGIVDVMEEQYREVIKEKPGVRLFLKKLHEHGIPVVVATASDRCLAKAAFLHLNLNDLIDDIVTCQEVGKSKDYPDVYEVARQKTGAKKSAAWVFEDSLFAATTAKKAGFMLAGVYDESGRQNWEMLKKLSDLALTDLTDFEYFYAGAKAIG